MRFAYRITDEEAQGLLAGRVPWGDNGSELGEVSVFLHALRAAVPAAPPAGAEATLVPRLAEVAHESGHRIASEPTRSLPATARRGAWRPRLALAAKVAVAVALLPAAMVGLAFAGVTLPEPAREAMERIGLDLPNQSAVDDEATADDNDADRADDGTKASGAGKANAGARGSEDRSDSGGGAPAGRKGERGENPNADGEPGHDSSGQGTPQLGEPAPITPPGQGGTPPGQGGTSPGRVEPQSAVPQETGPPGDIPPGQAKK